MPALKHSRRRFLALASALGIGIAPKRILGQSETDLTYIYSSEKRFSTKEGDSILKISTEAKTSGGASTLTKISVEISIPFPDLISGFITEIRWLGPDNSSGAYRDVAIRSLVSALRKDNPCVTLAFNLVDNQGVWDLPNELGKIRIPYATVGVLREDTDALFERDKYLIKKIIEDDISAERNLPDGEYRMELGEIHIEDATETTSPTQQLAFSEYGKKSPSGVDSHGIYTTTSLRKSSLQNASKISLQFNRVRAEKFERLAPIRTIPIRSINEILAGIGAELKAHQTAHENGEAKIKPAAGCTISTAVCEVIGLPDDCFELRTLRAYRDECLDTKEVETYQTWSTHLLGNPFFSTPKGFTALKRFYWKTIIPAVGLRILGLNSRVYRRYKIGVANLDRELSTHSPNK
ncbi:hypothetical protein MLD52_16710 [Puniceicoccaceae bacterium K14]|nr:hypothetical protein [Puniceicoccaceae bacterium K14]